jgi:hypothetical protein
MVSLFTVCAPARSGTMWFSRLLTTERSYCFHELAPGLVLRDPHVELLVRPRISESEPTSGPEFERAQRRGLLEACPGYFREQFARARIGPSIVGNSDSYVATRFASGLGMLWPSMRFLFSFRNGICAVHSRFVRQAHYTRRRLAVDAADFGTADFFEQCCYWWVWAVRQLEMHASWLASHDCAVYETRLEEVTSDAAELERVWSHLVDDWPAFADHATAFMSERVNARVNTGGVVTAAERWSAWSPADRESFRSIAGDTQVRLGYELPEA